MLQISASQGIDVMAATSHFYATEDRISSFLNRRRCSEERLKERMNQELTKGERIPRLIMGAAVSYTHLDVYKRQECEAFLKGGAL